MLNREQVMFETAISKTKSEKRAADRVEIVIEIVYKTTYCIGRSKHALNRRMESLSSVLDFAGHLQSRLSRPVDDRLTTGPALYPSGYPIASRDHGDVVVVLTL